MKFNHRFSSLGRFGGTGERIILPFLSRNEGKVFACGLGLVFMWIVFLIACAADSPGKAWLLMKMIAVHFVGGRGASILFMHGKNVSWEVVFFNAFVQDVALVMLVFPLFVYSCKEIIARSPSRTRWGRLTSAARRYRPIVEPFGIVGLLVFVWFPFFMTGPLVGAIIGSLVGMRLWVTIFVVLVGDALAVLSWQFASQLMSNIMGQISNQISLVIVATVVVAGVAGKIFRLLAKEKTVPEERPAEEEASEEINLNGNSG